jgi:hypothetical protein
LSILRWVWLVGWFNSIAVRSKALAAEMSESVQLHALFSLAYIYFAWTPNPSKLPITEREQENWSDISNKTSHLCKDQRHQPQESLDTSISTRKHSKVCSSLEEILVWTTPSPICKKSQSGSIQSIARIVRWGEVRRCEDQRKLQDIEEFGLTNLSSTGNKSCQQCNAVGDLGGNGIRRWGWGEKIKGTGFTELSQQLQDSLILFSTVDTVFLCNTSTSMR